MSYDLMVFEPEAAPKKVSLPSVWCRFRVLSVGISWLRFPVPGYAPRTPPIRQVLRNR